MLPLLLYESVNATLVDRTELATYDHDGGNDADDDDDDDCYCIRSINSRPQPLHGCLGSTRSSAPATPPGPLGPKQQAGPPKPGRGARERMPL